ncbi:MAG: hypothetical protein AABX11_04485 [Nanoarchaeota archaeon]
MTSNFKKQALYAVDDYIDTIVHLARNGYSETKIQQTLKTTHYYLYKALASRGLSFKALRHKGLLAHLEEVEKGKEHLFRVRKKFGYTPYSFCCILINLGKGEIFQQEAPLNRFHRHDLEQALQESEEHENPDFKAMILAGYSTGKIAEKFSIEKQAVDQYIKGYGLHHYRKQLKQKRKQEYAQKRDQVQQLVNLLTNYVQSRTHIQEGDSVETKVEKTLARRKLETGRTPVKRIPLLLREYFSAQEKGEKASFQELAERVGYSEGPVAYLHLANSGLHSLVHEKINLNPSEVALINRGASTSFSSTDIKYFGGLTCKDSAIEKRTQNKKRFAKSPITIYYKGRAGALQRLSYSDLSQIYESLDRGFTQEEIPILLPRILPESMSLAISQRKTHAPKIIQGLRKLFHDKDIQKPYVNTGGLN